MKLVKTSLLLYILIAMIACTKEATKYERIPTDEVKMLSFGFYEEDNPGQIAKDYIITNPKPGIVTVLLPEDVDKTKLTARFTLANNNIVSINGIEQKSGQTINDFTLPKDYILTHGINNQKYSIIISNAAIWKPLPFTIIDSSSMQTLKVNPVTGNPYIMYVQSRTVTNDQKAAMVTFDNNIWKDLGVISDGRASTDIDFTFNNAGVPYASYLDYTATISQSSSVKKYDGSGWSLVGNKGITTALVSYNTLSFSNDSKLLLFNMFDGRTGPLTRRELVISTFENNNWITNTTLPGRASSLSSYYLRSKNVNGILYLGLVNANAPTTISVYKYENNSWSTIIDRWSDPNPASTIQVTRDFDMEADENGNIYVALIDNSNAATYKQRVIKDSEATKSISSIGSFILGSSIFNFDLALSPTGTPYLFFKNVNNYPTVISFDKATQDWSNPLTFETESADALSIDFAPNGEAYASYLKNKRIIVYKLELQ